MKKIAFYCFWTFICLHTTVTFADAATDTIDASLAQVDAIIADTESGMTLESAPVLMYRHNTTPIYQTEYTAWELIHRTPMLQGLTWTGEIANFITPAMYMGTPLQTSANSMGYDIDMGATNYSECIRSETDASFGVDGALIEMTTEDELRNMAKYCATEFLGSYFSGKDYTTREEMLMFLFTMFDEGIELPGYFDDEIFVFDGEETGTTYSNVSSRAWFAPYLAAGRDIDMIPDYPEWAVAAKVTDNEIRMMIEWYIAFTGDTRDGFSDIHTEYGNYTISSDTTGLHIAKNLWTGITTLDSAGDEDIIEELFAE
jgi:hypothetical protein